MLRNVSHASYINFSHLNNLSSTDLSAFFARTEEPLDPGYINGPMIRDCYIMQYVHTGKGVVEINNNAFEVSAGQCFMTFPNALVSLIADEHDPWGKTWVCLHGTKVSYYLNAIGITEQAPVFPWNNQPKVLKEMHSYIDILDKNSLSFEFDQSICANKLFKLLFKICRHEIPTPQAQQTQEEYVRRAIQYIDYNYSRRITVSDIAAHVGLNRTYFSTVFKTHTNQTPQEFLLKRRIEKACDFFSNPNSTVASVAYSLGYEPHVFTRLFKQITGMSPIQYKNSIVNREKNQTLKRKNI